MFGLMKVYGVSVCVTASASAWYSRESDQPGVYLSDC